MHQKPLFSIEAFREASRRPMSQLERFGDLVAVKLPDGKMFVWSPRSVPGQVGPGHFLEFDPSTMAADVVQLPRHREPADALG
jgi:hypothetical protein